MDSGRWKKLGKGTPVVVLEVTILMRQNHGCSGFKIQKALDISASAEVEKQITPCWKLFFGSTKKS
jgi:hypothetical protein